MFGSTGPSDDPDCTAFIAGATKPFTVPLPLLPSTTCFAVYGATFPAVAVLTAALTLFGATCAWMHRRDRWHRIAVFTCVALASLIRCAWSVFFTAHAASIDDHKSAAHLAIIGAKYLVPVNALADAVTSWIDVVLALFWLNVVEQTGAPNRFVFLGFMVVSFVVLVACIIADYIFINDNMSLSYPAIVMPDQDKYGADLWRWTLWAVGVLLILSALSHLASFVRVAKVLISQVRRNGYGLLTARMKQLGLRALVIAAFTAVFGLLRSATILGRQAGIPLFHYGALSLFNPKFTTFYYAGVMNIPICVVTLSFLPLTLEVWREARREQQEREAVFGSSLPSAALLTPNGEVIRTGTAAGAGHALPGSRPGFHSFYSEYSDDYSYTQEESRHQGYGGNSAPSPFGGSPTYESQFSGQFSPQNVSPQPQPLPQDSESLQSLQHRDSSGRLWGDPGSASAQFHHE